jgi:hypothetical protein
MSRFRRRIRIDFAAINRAALPLLPAILQRLLPNGRRASREYVALNPRRVDRHLGSFRISLSSGKWADFACHDARGGDVVSLIAYLEGCSQPEAARKVAHMLGLDGGGHRHG